MSSRQQLTKGGFYIWKMLRVSDSLLAVLLSVERRKESSPPCCNRGPARSAESRGGRRRIRALPSTPAREALAANTKE